ncbi:diguanylate cyclase (GGDEF) domain-containing protein [Sphingomonas sp. NFR04]|nr:diguanylate cyclase (GGDEF) domain-containing protein [Sphingomonas sp. NFR04]
MGCDLGIVGKSSVRGVAIRALLRGWRVLLLGCLLVPAAAYAVPIPLDSRMCTAASPMDGPSAALSAIRFRCGEKPAGYQPARLWLQLDPQRYDIRGEAATLLVHQTRFDRLAVAFRYADGSIEWQEVRAGNFGDHWRPGAQIAFTPRDLKTPLRSITMRIDRLASAQLLRLRLVHTGEAGIETAVLGALIGAALTLLLTGAVYNLSLAFGTRRAYLGWQGAWAATVCVWGAIWSQFGLLLAPGLAGTLAAQTCTALSALSILLATLSATSALEKERIPSVLRATALALGIAVAVIGIPATLARGPLIESIAPPLAAAVLGNLVAVLACLIVGARRGSAEARDLLAAWSVPMAALALTQVIDIGTFFWGGGAQILVLFASAWQTLWLSFAASRRLARMRTERDLARAAEARASRLAEHDPLTAIRNRRGFFDAAEALIATAARSQATVALLLVDIDRFKAINDEHGHDAGDIVLCTIAARLAQWESPLCTVARLGGEEFALLTISGVPPVLDFAELVREEIAACDHRAAIGDQRVTISIGVAEGRNRVDLAKLYREADRALYAAKGGGRNQVRHAETVPPPVASAQRPAATG